MRLPGLAPHTQSSLSLFDNVVLVLAIVVTSCLGKASMLSATAGVGCWIYRRWRGDKTAGTDALIWVVLSCWINGVQGRKSTLHRISSIWTWDDRLLAPQWVALLILVASIAGIFVYRGKIRRPMYSVERASMFLYGLLGSSIVASLWINGVHDFRGLVTAIFGHWLVELRYLEIQIFSIIILLAGLAGTIVYRGEEPRVRFADRLKTRPDGQLPPLLIPARTTHTRTSPKKHSFGYSYLLVGIPVGWHGRSGSALSADTHLDQGWFHVSAEDYLYRSSSPSTLDQKLREYLRSEGVPDSSWSHAYLVTAPKFLGYSFNPVSFWYIYDSQFVLSAMILEVNNTFDERRMYLLKAGPDSDCTDAGEPEAKATFSHVAKTFTTTWRKDFHVSPFNDRGGSYTLRATDPLSALSALDRHPKTPLISNLITLKVPHPSSPSSPSTTPLLIAHVFSTTPPRDPSLLSFTDLSTFLTSWCTTGLLTFPRILRQAATLYFSRRLPLFFRPEPLSTNISRPATPHEEILEQIFRLLLTTAVAAATKPLRIDYCPPRTMLLAPLALKSRPVKGKDPAPTLHIRVLTPAFYANLPLYATLRETLGREGPHADPRAKTLELDDQSRVLDTFLAAAELVCAERHADASPGTTGAARTEVREAAESWTQRTRWRALWWLRSPSRPSATASAAPLGSAPSAATSPSHSDAAPTSPQAQAQTQTQTSTPSDIDTFVRLTCAESSAVYRGIATQILLAQRYAGGMPQVVTAADVLVRCALVLLGVMGWSWAGCAVHVWGLGVKGV